MWLTYFVHSILMISPLFAMDVKHYFDEDDYTDALSELRFGHESMGVRGVEVLIEASLLLFCKTSDIHAFITWRCGEG